jgi:dolichol-phosphate mannosyltransferase
MKRLVLVLTYNEQENIAALIARLRELRYDVLVVDDRGADQTAEEVASLAARDDAVHLLARPERLGYASALRDGWRWALEQGYDQIAQLDADGSHDPAALPLLFRALDEVDLAIGSRYCFGGATPSWGFARRALSRLAGWYARRALSLPLTDPTSGFRAWRADLLRRIAPACTRAHGFVVLVESACLAVRAGARVREAPIVFHPRRAGEAKMSRAMVAEGLRVVMDLRHGA